MDWGSFTVGFIACAALCLSILLVYILCLAGNDMVQAEAYNPPFPPQSEGDVPPPP